MLWLADVHDEATSEERTRALRDVGMAKTIGEHLERVYPAHGFLTEVDSKMGIVKISHPLLPRTWRYVIKLSTLKADPGMRAVTKAGGELLERFYLPRGKYRSDLWEEAGEKFKRTKHGIVSRFNWKTGERKYEIPTELAL